MDDKKIEDLLDGLILKSETKDKFIQLSDVQRAIGALQILISTSTRSGLEVFFEPRNNFLWLDALSGFKFVGVEKYQKLYEDLLKAKENGLSVKSYVTRLQSGIVDDFELLYTSIRKFIFKEFNNLSKNI